MGARTIQHGLRKWIAVALTVLLSIAISIVVDAPEAKAAEHTFYGLLRSKTSPAYSLAIIEPSNASTTVVKNLDLSQVGSHHFNDLRSAGYSSVTGKFYAMEPTYQELFSIEPQSGLVSFVGSFSPAAPGGITAMAINDSGDAYALSENKFLYKVSLSTAELYSGSAVSGLSSAISGIESLSFVGTKLYGYAEVASSWSDTTPVLGQVFTVEYISSQWKLTGFLYDKSRATGSMDAYGMVVQDNTILVNQLIDGENRLQAAPTTASYGNVTFASRGVLASGQGKLVRGTYSNAPATISFDSTGGSSISPIYAAAGSVIQEPPVPTQAGKSLEGWFTAPTGGTRIQWPYTLTSSTTVFAQWNTLSAELSFDSHGGSPVAPIFARVGDDIAEPADPTRANYGFDGWYTSATGGTQVSWPYALTTDTTLHAVWSQTSATLTLNKQNGSSVEILNSYAGVEVDQPQNPVKSGSTFKGWFTAQTGGTAITWPLTLTADITVYAQWENSLKFVSQGGTPVDTILVNEGSSVSAPTAPTYAHKSFAGWFTAPTGGTAITWPLTLNTNTTVYAQWQRIPATLSFDSHGGSAVAQLSSFEGEFVDEPAEPTLANYGFDGWYTSATGGTQVTWPYVLNGNTTLHAVWSQTPATLTLNKQNGTSNDVTNSFAGVEIDQPQHPTKSGATFTGWFDAPTGGNFVTWPYTLTTSITLYAQWENSLSFSSEGGSPVSTIYANEGSSVLAPTAPTRDHRTFAGWFTAATGGTAITWPLTLNTNTTVYAQWLRIPATLSFDSHGGSSVAPLSSFEEELVAEPDEPTRTNAAFEGWFLSASGGEKLTWPYSVPTTQTLHAQWNTVPATLTFDSTGGTPVAQINTYAGEELTMPASPTRAGYAFTGWYVSTTSSTKVTWPYEILQDVTLYAGWVAVGDAELAATGMNSVDSRLMLGAGLILAGAAVVLRRRARR